MSESGNELAFEMRDSLQIHHGERNVKGKEPLSFEFSQHYFVLITSHRGLMNMHQKIKKRKNDISTAI